MLTDEQEMLSDIFSITNVEDAHVREIYARFGLAIYHAQVFEHCIVNALTILDLIPNKRHLVKSRDGWEAEVDSFMDKHFEKTMGSLLKALAQVTTIDPQFESKLKNALRKRNYLAHEFFRDKAEAFMTVSGRRLMLIEIDHSSAIIRSAEAALAEIVTPIRNKYGITDAVIEEEFEKLGSQ